MSTMDQRITAKRMRERNAIFFREQPRPAFYDPTWTLDEMLERLCAILRQRSWPQAIFFKVRIGW
jgi:hypothetical protein